MAYFMKDHRLGFRGDFLLALHSSLLTVEDVDVIMVEFMRYFI